MEIEGGYLLISEVGPPRNRNPKIGSVIRKYRITQIRPNGYYPTEDTPDTIDQGNFNNNCEDTRVCN